ncbi:MAG: hypothetical protein RLZZ450_3945 [Pseudomonadota bacterium]
MIHQGDVVWISLPPAKGSAPQGRRPGLVLQHDRFNNTKIATAVVVAITSQLKYAELPGNVRLRKGEAGLPHASVLTIDGDPSVSARRSKLSDIRDVDHQSRDAIRLRFVAHHTGGD